MNNIEQQNSIEKELRWRICNMMAGNFDRWQPDADPESVASAVHSASLVASGIAHKLAKALHNRGTPVTPDTWQEMVEAATCNSFVEMDETEPLIRVGRNPSFVRAVEECTAQVVAPAGSDWARNLMRLAEERVRNELRRWGLPNAQIEKFLDEWRSEWAVRF